MSRSRDFHRRSLCSSNGFASFTSIEPTGNRPLIEVRSPNSPQVVHSQLGSMSMNNHTVIQHRSYCMPHQEEPSTWCSCSNLPHQRIDKCSSLPWVVGSRNSIPPMMPQMYSMGRREYMGNVTPLARFGGVDGYSEFVSNHQVVPNHASSSTNVGYHNQKALKRKAMMTELSLGRPTSVVVESTTNDFFGFANSFQEEQPHIENKTMTLLLISEEDSNESVERMEREFQFFPQHMTVELFGNESEFSLYQMSSSYANGSVRALDLSLNLSSSSGESSMALDLSLKLSHNPCA